MGIYLVSISPSRVDTIEWPVLVGDEFSNTESLAAWKISSSFENFSFEGKGLVSWYYGLFNVVFCKCEVGKH